MSDVPNAPDERDRSHLEHSLPFPWDRTCDAPGWEPAVDHFLSLLEASESRRRARRSADRGRLRATLGSMLLGLYAAWKADPERWLAYSRNNNDYGPAQPYVPPHATSVAVTTSADFLATGGFIEHRRGSYYRPAGATKGWGYRSRVRALPRLVEALESLSGLSPEHLGIADWTPLVRLKAPPDYPGGPKRLVPFKDTDQIARMREQIRELNTFLSGFQIDLEPGSGSAWDGQPDHGSELDEIASLNRSAICLYRVFNNERFDHGGRFYGGWWQQVPKRERRRLLIDGEETVELDYKSLHPRLCYHLEGAPLAPDADPYRLPGLDVPGIRDLVKIGFNQLLNVAPGVNPAPPPAAQRLPAGITWEHLLERIAEAHAALRHWFRSGRGVELQRIDSDMAAMILDHLRYRGICCLPVHDSFIVPRSAEAALGKSMALAYRGALSSRAPLTAYPVIAGWSSPEVERKVMASLPPA